MKSSFDWLRTGIPDDRAVAARLLHTGEVVPRKVPMFPVMASLRGERAAGAGSNRTLQIEVDNLIDESMPISTTVGQEFR